MTDDEGAAIPAAWARRVWQVLVEECGCRDRIDSYTEFRLHVGKWLWCGHEFYNDGQRWRVNCNGEDRTPEREAMIASANARLAALRKEM